MYKWISTYDVNGYLTERVFQGWDSNTSTWNSSGKRTFTINASGIIIEDLKQTWDNINSIWVNSERWINILWYEWTGDPDDSEYASYTVLWWTNGIWANYYRVNITYDAYGGSVKTQESYFNGNWENTTRETYSYDQHKNYTGWQFEMWFNNTWSIDMGNKNILTYTGDDVMEMYLSIL